MKLPGFGDVELSEIEARQIQGLMQDPTERALLDRVSRILTQQPFAQREFDEVASVISRRGYPELSALLRRHYKAPR